MVTLTMSLFILLLTVDVCNGDITQLFGSRWKRSMESGHVLRNSKNLQAGFSNNGNSSNGGGGPILRSINVKAAAVDRNNLLLTINKC